MSGNKSGRVGLGNIISLAGLALLGFFTFMGALMLTGGNLGAAAGIALGSVIVLSLLLSAAVYSKKADTHFSKWKKVEIAAVILFLIAAVFPAGYVTHFFDIMSAKDELQKAAVDDAASIRDMFRTYEEAERAALAVTTTGLQNAYGEDCDLNVEEYKSAASIDAYEDIDTWILNERRLLLGDTGADGMAPYLTFRNNVDSVLNLWAVDVKSWDLMAIGRQSKVPGELAPAVVSELNARSQAGKLPVINFNSDSGLYQMDSPNQTVTLTLPALTFEKGVTSRRGIKALGIILYVAIIALIAVRYLLTPRSEKTEIGEGQNINNLEGVNRL